MKPYALVCLLWAFPFILYAQSTQPGGVPGVVLWYAADTAGGIPGLRNRITGHNDRISIDKARTTFLNFHPALVLTAGDQLQIDLGVRDWRYASFFTVYQSADTTVERNIWHIGREEQASLVLTTDRMADLAAVKYMNFTDVVRNQPKVNSYAQHKDNDSLIATRQWWRIGPKPVAPLLPVQDFAGLVPEIVAYDRVLNRRERLQVASCLALKYGITLTEPGASYLNSAGDKIWDGWAYSNWHRNIAGIGRDDSSGLLQQKAASSNTPGLLTMLTNDSLPNNTFLLWGDNGKPLTLAGKVAGFPRMLQTNWLVKPAGNTAAWVTSLVLDSKAIDAPLPVEPVYWLVIDPSGEGKFNTPATQFIRMDQPDRSGRLSCTNVVWDHDGSGKDVWGVIAGPALMVAALIRAPNCTMPASGGLQLRIIGGKAPYRLQVSNATRSFLYNQPVDGTLPVEADHLAVGKYQLRVTDATGLVYTDSFYLNSLEAPSTMTVEDTYTIPASGMLTVAAAARTADGYSWEWTGPGNFQSRQPQVTLTVPGLYTLRASKDGCTYAQDITVRSTPAHMLYDVTVYPNPSTEVFYARVKLDKAAPVKLSIYAPDGKLLSIQQGKDRMNYLFRGALKTSGTYQLVFMSGLSTTTKRLLIVK